MSTKQVAVAAVSVTLLLSAALTALPPLALAQQQTDTTAEPTDTPAESVTEATVSTAEQTDTATETPADTPTETPTPDEPETTTAPATESESESDLSSTEGTASSTEPTPQPDEDTTSEQRATPTDIESSSTTVSNADPGRISYGETVEGDVGLGDFAGNQPPNYYDRVNFTAERGDVFNIEASAEEPVTLILLDESGERIASSDHDSNPQLTYTKRDNLWQNYTVRVYGDDEMGTIGYTLSLRLQKNIEKHDLGSIDYGETKQGVVGAYDPGGTYFPQYYERVNFTGEQGDVIALSATSKTHYTAVELRGPGGGIYVHPGRENNSRISSYTLNRTGQYTVRVYMDDDTEIHRYNISLERVDTVSYYNIDSISYGETKRGAVDIEDSAGDTVPNYYERVNFTGERGDVITMAVRSNDSASLQVIGPGGGVVGGEGAFHRYEEGTELTLNKTGEHIIRVWMSDDGWPHFYNLTLEKVGKRRSAGGSDGSSGNGRAPGDSGGESSPPDQSGESDSQSKRDSPRGEDGESQPAKSDSRVSPSGSLALDARASETIDGEHVRFTLEVNNTAEEPQAILVNFDPVLASLPDGWTIVDRTDNGGVWRDAENAWLFQNVHPGGSVEASVTLEPPAGADGEYSQTVPARSNSSRVTDSASFTVQETSLLEAVDRNDDGRIGDGEILDAIEWWRTDSTVADTDLRISNQQILRLSELWQEGGSYR